MNNDDTRSAPSDNRLSTDLGGRQAEPFLTFTVRVGLCIHGRSLHPWTRCDDCGSYYRTIA